MKEIKLTQNQIALVDDSDFEYLNQFKWQALLHKGKWYAKREVWNKDLKNYEKHFMHRIIYPDFKMVDHINGETLDNQRCNLREANHSQNAANSKLRVDSTSGFKGVDYIKAHNRWRARLKSNNTEFNLGEYRTPIEAAQAYNIASKLLFEEFASLNPVPEPISPLILKVHTKIERKKNKDG